MQSRTSSSADFLSVSSGQPLLSSALRVTLALQGSWHGSYGTACCPAHEDRAPSLSVKDGENGRLLLKCHAGCDFLAVMHALRMRGILDSWPVESPLQSMQPAVDARGEADKRVRQVRQLWSDARPVAGTLAETYLRERGITCVLPDSLRFHPTCFHGPTAQRLPAMLALVEGLPQPALHRTYLRPDGKGKAEVSPNKAMLGPVVGGAVRLTNAPGPLIVAEGIETALSLASGHLRMSGSIWAALSASGMAALHLPDRPDRLIVATDGDTAGDAAGRQLASRAQALGWQVSLMPAPVGADWNDVLGWKAQRP